MKNNNYKNAVNKFETKGDMTIMTVQKKDGSELSVKIDTADLDKVKSYGSWFAEWNKDYNNYIVVNISKTKLNKKKKPLKQSLHTFVMDASPNAPVIHVNKDTLDNRKANLTLFNRNDINEIEKQDDGVVVVLLKDNLGNVTNKALISETDLSKVINNNYTWVEYRNKVVANTPEGRIYMDQVIMEPSEKHKVHHINKNPMDCRRENLELFEIPEEE